MDYQKIVEELSHRDNWTDKLIWVHVTRLLIGFFLGFLLGLSVGLMI